MPGRIIQMEEPSDVPELTPEQQILFDIETDKILENVPEDKVEISDQDEQQLEEVLNLLRNKAAAREGKQRSSQRTIVNLLKLYQSIPFQLLPLLS